MNWEPAPYRCDTVLDEDEGFSIMTNPSLDQVSFSNATMWVVINAAPMYFGKLNPAPFAFAVRSSNRGCERGRGSLSDALDLVREMAVDPHADLDKITKALRTIMDPIDLMAFIATIPQRECEPVPESANRPEKPSIFRAFADRFLKAR